MGKRKKVKMEATGITLTPDLLQKLRDHAEKNETSVSAILRGLAKEYIAKQGVV